MVIHSVGQSPENAKWLLAELRFMIFGVRDCQSSRRGGGADLDLGDRMVDMVMSRAMLHWLPLASYARIFVAVPMSDFPADGSTRNLLPPAMFPPWWLWSMIWPRGWLFVFHPGSPIRAEPDFSSPMRACGLWFVTLWWIGLDCRSAHLTAGPPWISAVARGGDAGGT